MKDISKLNNLLILTQKVDKNDDVLGFFHGWLLEFAKNYKKVTVICLYEGDHSLPENVKVLSLGKEKNSDAQGFKRRFPQIKYLINFYKFIWQERGNYDKVFVHMNPIYVVLGGIFWRFRGNKIALWYTHKSVDLKLKIAEKLINIIFSASKESFQMKTKKLKVIGHGIDVDKMNCKNFLGEKYIDIVCVGRISPIKNQKLLLEAADFLVNELGQKNISIVLVGGAFSGVDKKYQEELKNFVTENNISKNIIFAGSVSNKDIANYYCRSKISVNLCPTGGMDKVVLESMSCCILLVVFNKTFEDMLGDKGFVLKNLYKEELSEKILNLLKKDEYERKEIGKQLRNIVIEKYSLTNLIKNIKEFF